MSTRATYQFRNQEYRPDVTVYIHHDGYPEGAAGLYLLPAIEKGDGYLAVEAFIRANERAEITRSHDAHGDTEYRYTFDLKDGMVKVEGRRWDRTPEWQCEWFGNLAAFVNKYAGTYRPGVKVRAQGKRWLTAEMAQAEAVQKRAAATSYAERFPHYTGNIASGNADAERAERFAADFALEMHQ